jgi:putative transposase
MDVWLTVNEVRNLENISDRAVRKRIKEGKYQRVRNQKSARSRGGMEWQVHLSCLSPPAQARYLEEHGGRLKATEILGEVPAELKAQALLEYNTAPEWSRELAHLRYEILQAFEQYAPPRLYKGGKRKPKHTASRFVQEYQRRRIDVSDRVYEKVQNLSVGKIYRWRQDFRARGMAGLLAHHGQKGARALSPKQQNYIIRLIQENPDIRAARIYDYLLHTFKEAPNPRTVGRFINRWKKENPQLYLFWKNPEEWRHRYQIAFGREDQWATHFCHGWEMDTTPADVICADGVRYKCLVNIDIFCRRAHVLVSETSKAMAIAALMRRGLLEWGIPEVLIKDNGKEYTSRHIEAICATFRIETPFVPPYTPEAKGIVERFCETLAVGLFEELPGYCGHNVAERQAIRARDRARGNFVKQFMTSGAAVKVEASREDLQAFVNSWIQNVYEQRPHRGLNGLSPVQKAAQSPRPARRLEGDQAERVLDILLAEIDERVVQNKGIQLNSTWYQALKLADFVGERVSVRLDMEDAGRIYVFSTKGEYLCTAVAEELAGFAVEELRRGKREQKRKLKEAGRSIEALCDIPESPMAELLKDKETADGRVVPLIRTETIGLEEAEEGVGMEEPEEGASADGIFYGPDHRARRYKYLLKKQAQKEPFTEQEREFLEDYMQTREWELLFGDDEAIAL